MTCEQGLLRLLWGGARSWSATALPTTHRVALKRCLSKSALLSSKIADLISVQISNFCFVKPNLKFYIKIGIFFIVVERLTIQQIAFN